MRWSDRLRRPGRRVLRGDVVAGITMAAYLVPQVLAYSGLAQVSPEAGLWAAFAALAVYFLLLPLRRPAVLRERRQLPVPRARVGGCLRR